MRPINEDYQEPATEVTKAPDNDCFTPTTWESDWIDLGGEG
jgi:hypothetical protein